MSRIGFLVVAHKYPDQLRRLLSVLKHDRIKIFLHIDQKIDIQPFKESLNDFDIVWVKRERAQWGSIGMVNVILNGLKAAAEDDTIERLTMISGMDYPIKPLEYILSFFDEDTNRDFIDIVKFEDSGWSEAKKKRITKHYFFIKDKLFEYPQNPNGKSFFRSVLNFIFGLFLSKERPFPKGLIPYGGFTWFSFSRQMVISILDFHQKRPDLYDFNKKCLSSDEIYLQTVIGNLDPSLTSIYPSLTYTDWESGDVPHPRILSTESFTALSKSECLFARKFDKLVDQSILDRIDREILKLN